MGRGLPLGTLAMVAAWTRLGVAAVLMGVGAVLCYIAQPLAAAQKRELAALQWAAAQAAENDTLADILQQRRRACSEGR